MGRSRGISWFQFYGRGASFFATYVNPVGLARIAWKWLLVYCCWLAFELVFIYFFFPETSGRTLEELSFCKLFSCSAARDRANCKQCSRTRRRPMRSLQLFINSLVRMLRRNRLRRMWRFQRPRVLLDMS